MSFREAGKGMIAFPYGFLGRGPGGNLSLASKERFPPEKRRI